MSLDVFVNIRDRVASAFRRANYDHTRFPEIAEEALFEAEIQKNYRFDFDELTRWVIEPNRVPPPNEPYRFSDFPTMVACGNGFYVEILVWTHGTSSIHQHGFPGNTQDRLAGFLRRRAEHVEENSSGLVPLLQKFTGGRCDLDVAMESPSWINEQSIGDETADHTYAAAVFAASLHPHEPQMEWEVRFKKSYRVRFGGLVTPELISMTVAGSKLEYTTANGMRVMTEISPCGEGMREVKRFAIDGERSMILAEESDRDVFGVCPLKGFHRRKCRCGLLNWKARSSSHDSLPQTTLTGTAMRFE